MEEFKNSKVLENKLAALESHIDMMETELSYLNKILIECGFPKGIATLKDTVEELILEKEEARRPKD